MIQPIGDRVLVKQLKKENKSEIILAVDEEDMLLPKGEVIWKCHIDGEIIDVGDIVYFNELAGERIKDEGEEYLVLKYSDIIAKVC